jgi:hypothetical protein
MLLLWVFLWPALCGVWCFYGLNYGIACACLHDTSMLASMIYLQAIIPGLSLIVTNSLSGILFSHGQWWKGPGQKGHR